MRRIPLSKAPTPATFNGAPAWKALGAAIENVSLAYLPQNNPPVIRSISVSMQTGSAQKAAAAAAATSSTSAAYSITVTDTGETSTPAGTPTQTLSHGSGSQIQVTWQADDPDGDRLLYSLYFRGEDEKEWKLLRANVAENSLLLDGDVLADGRYYFRVIASDQPSNAANVARTDELVSSPVLIDNTPPVVSLSRAPPLQRSRWKWTPTSWIRPRPCAALNIRSTQARGLRWKPPMASPIRRASNITSRSNGFARANTCWWSAPTTPPTTPVWPKWSFTNPNP